MGANFLRNYLKAIFPNVLKIFCCYHPDIFVIGCFTFLQYCCFELSSNRGILKKLACFERKTDKEICYYFFCQPKLKIILRVDFIKQFMPHTLILRSTSILLHKITLIWPHSLAPCAQLIANSPWTGCALGLTNCRDILEMTKLRDHLMMNVLFQASAEQKSVHWWPWHKTCNSFWGAQVRFHIF
jgi:hypothetical protein